VAKGCLKNTLVSAPKGDLNLVSTTMRSAERSGAVIRHSNDTFQRGLWATPRQSTVNWFAGQHSKPMSSFLGLYTPHNQNFASLRGSRKRGLSSYSGTPGNWTTEAHRVDGSRQLDQGGHPVRPNSLCLTYCRAVLRRASWGRRRLRQGQPIP
jgi:hypothetical protein